MDQLIPRRYDRQSVLRTAKLTYQGAVLDCIVVDLSTAGLRVQLASVVPVPEEVTVQFPAGSSFKAIRRWSRGLEIGFEFAGAAHLGADARVAAWEVYEEIRSAPLHGALERLRTLNHFGDPSLRTLVQETEGAMDRLEKALRRLAQGA